MNRLYSRPFVWAAAAVFLTGCQVQKSANPLSPAIAGPMEGVVISTPNLIEPGQDWVLRTRDQPVTLLIQNADTSGARPLKYSIAIASDAEFKNIVFARVGVEPGADGVTRMQLPDKLAAGTYWWRTRAEDGANSGPYSAVKSFKVLAQVVLGAPTPAAPSNGATLPGLAPEFKVKAGDRSGVTDDLEYVVQVSNNSSFTSIAATFRVPETWPETRIAQGYAFLASKTYHWRARVLHSGDGGEVSNWSAMQTFTTPTPVVVPADPAPSPGSGGGSNPGSCNSSQGSDIADCIEARYPQYLVAGVSLSRRTANMQFLRDRVIEHARCKGLDVGLNNKRGNPNDISIDFIAWRRNGRVEGVDVGSAWDDTHRRLGLGWHTYGPPNYGHPYFRAYGPVKCS